MFQIDKADRIAFENLELAADNSRSSIGNGVDRAYRNFGLDSSVSQD